LNAAGAPAAGRLGRRRIAGESLLAPAEWMYRAINRVRRALYRRGLLRARQLPRVVVSVGNRAVGGAGKTPTVIAIARRLESEGLRVTVLSRGYGRRDVPAFALVTTPDAERFGDEPALIARSLPGVDVVVGADRFTAGMRYLLDGDCDVFLLDDAFQHLPLQRDIDIVIESKARWYREGPTALADADLVLIRDSLPPPAGRPSFSLTLVPVRMASYAGALGLEVLRGVPVFAFSGLADNGRFFATLESLGARIVGRREFPDHHRYSSVDVAAIRLEATRAEASQIVTTEKDAIKLREPDIMALEVSAQFGEDAAFFGRLLQGIRDAQNARPR
jgi:tetraacyldisaccharide 4'-kinase